MTEPIIDRAERRIDAKDFVKLTQLHLDHDWLKYEPEALFELWCLSEDNKQKDLIEHLIKNFSFIDSRALNEGGKGIANKIEEGWNLKPHNTFLVATCGDDKPDGSQCLIQVLKNKFSPDWKETNFYNKITVGANEIPNNSNIILVDDFIGTGDTMVRKIDYVNSTIIKRKLKNITLSIVSLASMSFAKEVLDKLNIKYHSEHWLKKGIEELIDEKNKESATQSMEQMEEKLQKRYRGKRLPNFGYKRSEALFALEAYNIPNNVFPIFWWPFYKGGNRRKTLFTRI